jgi:hypothetical protein
VASEGGFVVPASRCKRFLQSLRRIGHRRRGWSCASLCEDTRRHHSEY